jgi:hypothetical protein
MVVHHKGKRVPIVREVALTSKSLNCKETFIYDGGLTLLIWHGREVTSHEKIAVRCPAIITEPTHAQTLPWNLLIASRSSYF